MQPGGNFSNTYNSIWMTSLDKTKSIDGLPDADTPVIFNVQETGKWAAFYAGKNEGKEWERECYWSIGSLD